MKKAQSLSINTIIIASLALIVLVVLIVIFGGNIKKFTGATGSCETQGGECKDNIAVGKTYELGGCPAPEYIRISDTNCDKETSSDKKPRTCCVAIMDNKKNP